MESDLDEKDIACRSWQKLASSLEFEGYREGSSAGRDSTFQQGFDAGYKEGFKNAYKFGLHNGILSFLKSEDNCIDPSVKEQLSSNHPFEKPSRGFCVLCSEKEENGEDKRTVQEIIQLQNQTILEQEKNVLKADCLEGLDHCKIKNAFSAQDVDSR